MKRKTVLLLLCITVTITFIGCNGKQSAEKQDEKTQVTAEQTVSCDTKTSDKKEHEETKQNQKQEASAVNQKEKNNTTEKEEVTQKQQTVTTENSQTASSQRQSKEDTSQSTTTPATTTPTTPTTETPKVEETTPVPETPQATANDSQAVANKVIEYINSYRSSPATKLPGLTKYAEYRSRQLISNFAHDTNDERAAATTLQYGTYIDPPLYGMTGEPYYEAGAREAIAKGGYVGTIDEVAQRLATLVRNSAGHWAYVGSSEYPYIAVGVTYESGMWYCDIAMARVNTDNN